MEADKLAKAVTITDFEEKLWEKIDAATNRRLITTEEADKLAAAVASDDLEVYSLKNIEGLEEIKEAPIEENKYIKFFDEVEGVEKKISLQNFILSTSKSVYPTYRSLEGDQDGKTTQFKYRGTLIQETAELYIGGLLYPVNVGFTFEDDIILITGAPIPTAEDEMRLKAIYLT